MTELTPETPAVVTAPDTNLKFTLNGIPGEQTFDCATIPGEARLELLKKATLGYITNRVNQVGQRHAKDELVVAWNAYEAAIAADIMQTLVAKPDKEKPVPDYAGAFARAIEALTKGDIRGRAADGEGKKSKALDPLAQAVTNVVVREVYDARKAAGEKITFLAVKAAIGNGIEYLDKMIEAKVAAGVDRAGLEKYKEDRYIAPAKVMLGMNTSKKLGELPNILGL